MSTPMEQIEAGPPKFITVGIYTLVESKLNPRRQYNADRIKELAESITSVGMIEPLVVRLNGQPAGATDPRIHYEIIAGSRRFRAAKIAEIKEVPVLVREMTDQQALEIMVIENNQRQDVNAMEEAEGYQRLMKLGYGLDRLAERIGRSHKYIYDRVKLLQLVPEAKNLVLESIVSAGHAILLARLRPEEQKRAMDRSLGGLWQVENLLFDPNDSSGEDPVKTKSVRELQSWIDEHVRFDRNIPVNQDLFPETAAAVRDAKDMKLKVIQITHDYLVKPDAKEGNTERIFSQVTWKLADGTKGNKACEKSVTGVIVVGPDRGAAYKVCVNKDCDVHWGKERRAREKAKAGVAKSKWTLETQRSHEKLKREQEQHESRRREWNRARKAILEACAAKVKTSKPGVLAETIYRAFHSPDLKNAQALLGRKWKTAEDLLQLFAMTVLVDDYDEWNAYNTFPARAKRLGVDVKGILKSAQQTKIYPELTCTKCGCTEGRACDDGCSWLKLDKKSNAGLCSSCAPVHTSAKTKKRHRDKKK